MKKNRFITPILLSVFILPLFFSAAVPVQAQDTAPDPGNGNVGLCLPNQDGSYQTQDCLMQGPARNLQDLAAVGITFPAAPLFMTNPPAELGSVPFTYAKVVDEEVPLYSSLADIEAEKPSDKLPFGKIKYISIYNKAETSKGVYYQIANEKWISKESVSLKASQFFQGYQFVENPKQAFAWILDQTVSRSEPSINAPETGKTYYRYNVVHTYDTVMENQIEWVRIGPREWIDHRKLARVIPNNDKPEAVTADRWIEVNLYEQVLLVHEGDQVVFATLVATGVDPFFTQPGVFQIYKMIEYEYMRGAFEADRSDYYYLEDVPYIMYFDQARALHGAYWHTLFGYQRSHGCVNLSIADSHWLYDWAEMGDFVYVWDPSGQTPTDPEYYGSGGA